MFLLDCGNSTCKLVLDISHHPLCFTIPSQFKQEQGFLLLSGNGRFSYSQQEMTSFDLVLRDLLSHIPDHCLPIPVIGISVCKPDRRDWVSDILKQNGLTQIQWLETPGQFGSFSNQYETPSKLGIDRFIAALAAANHFPNERLLVINTGTATTIDLVDPIDGFCGGLILPGVGTMLGSLERRTAQLGRQQVRNIATIDTGLVPKNTRDGMIYATLRAHYHSIVSSFRDWKAERCVLTGGWANTLLHILQQGGLTPEYFPYLIFEGLRTWLQSERLNNN